MVKGKRKAVSAGVATKRPRKNKVQIAAAEESRPVRRLASQARKTVEEDVTQQPEATSGQQPTAQGMRVEPEMEDIITVDEMTKSSSFTDLSKVGAQVYLDLLESSWTRIGLRSIEPSERKKARDLYIAAKMMLSAKITSEATTVVPPVRIPCWDISTPDKLPTFSGDFDKWAPFRDIFLVEVHLNPDMSKAKKLIKLTAALEGRAKQAIGDYSVTDERNYDLAWESLCSIYDNQHLTAQSHLGRMKTLKYVTNGAGEDMRALRDAARVQRRHLLSSFSTEELFDFVFWREYIEPRLSPEIRKQWEETRTTSKLPTWEEILAFLNKKTTSWLSVSSEASNVDIPRKPTNHTSVRKMTNDQGVNKKPERLAQQMQCYYCHQFHALIRCANFAKLSTRAREEFLKDRRLCLNCASRSHETGQCPQQGCKSCPGATHTKFSCLKGQPNVSVPPST